MKFFRQILCCVLMCSTLVYAANTCTTCYLDPVNGNDTWDGTSKVFVSGTTGPWKHFRPMPSVVAGSSAATQVPAPGDTYVLKGGNTWSGHDDLGIPWKWAGTSASPIRITADPTWYTSATVTGKLNATGFTVTRVVDSTPISYPFTNMWVGTTLDVNGTPCTITSVQSQNMLTCSASLGIKTNTSYSHTGYTRAIWDCIGDEACGAGTIADAGEMDIFYGAKQWVFVDNIEALNMTYPVNRGSLITAYNATSTTSVTFTVPNTFSVGQVIAITSFSNATQFNGKFIQLTAASPTSITGTALNGATFTVASGSDNTGVASNAITAYNATSSTSVTFTAINTFAVNQVVSIASFAGTGTQFNGKPIRITAANGTSYTGTLVRSTDFYTTGSGTDTGAGVVSTYVRNGFESGVGTVATPTNFHGTYLFWHSSIIPANPRTIIRMNFSKSLNNGAAGASNGTTWEFDTCDEGDEIGGHGGDCFVTGDIVDSVDAIRNVGLFNGNFNQITNSNLLHLQTTSLDTGDHCDIAQIGQYSGTVNIFAGNVIGDNSGCGGGTIAGVNQFSGPTSINYSYNNVFWGIVSNQAIFACGGHGNQGYGSCNLFNNSVNTTGTNNFAVNALSPGHSIVNYANNHFVNPTGTRSFCFNQNVAGGGQCNPIGTHNLQQTTTQATTSPNTPGGYTDAGVGGFALAPGANTWSTVGVGDTIATLNAGGMNVPSPFTDTSYGGTRNPNTRPNPGALDIGAFNFSASPFTAQASCQGTANGTIKEPCATGANINAVCTSGVVSGTTSASYAGGTSVDFCAAATSGTFLGWTDPTCIGFGTGNCDFSIFSSPTVTANFMLIPTNTLLCNGFAVCSVQLGQSVTLSSVVANMQSPAQVDDNVTVTDPNDDAVYNTAGIQMQCQYPTVCNGTFNGASSPSFTFKPQIQGFYTIQAQSGTLQSTPVTVLIFVNASLPYGQFNH